MKVRQLKQQCLRNYSCFRETNNLYTKLCAPLNKNQINMEMN